jgi:hypothetical protein
MELSGRAITVIQRALRQGLVDKKVFDTALFDWENKIRPRVVTQLTAEMILSTKGGGETILEQIMMWLAGHGLTLKKEVHKPDRAGTVQPDK